ncbi:MAG: heavy metal sensor histidine kinase [Pseudomonadota bacterium]
MRLAPPQLRSSLALRLMALFCVGSALIMAAVGYTLYHALRVQVEARDLAEVTGKTEVIEHLLREIGTSEQLAANLQRFRDIPVGHAHLSVGVRVGGEWLLKPRDEIVAVASRVASSPAASASAIVTAQAAEDTWWLRRIYHEWPGPSAGAVDVVLAVDVSDTQRLLRGHAVAAVLVTVLGTLLSGVLSLFVARRGLAPIAQVAARAERITAQRLGTTLAVQDAPAEIRGLVESINHMLGRLNDSFQALEQFSADIAHELRTPINNLLLQTQVTLNRPRQAEEYRETLLSNLEELRRLHRMVSDMLFLARADRGMLALDMETVDLAQEAANVAEYFEPAASEKSQDIVITGHAAARGDRLMIRRTLTNLLSNAVRYAPAGRRIEVSIESRPDVALVAVTNSCAPIPAEELPRLFARFARRDHARDEDAEGAGLGLAIVDSIMRLHGGSAQAESGDFGVRFTLRFPHAVTLQ